MALNPQAQALLDRLARFELIPLNELEPVAARQQSAKEGNFSHPPEKVAKVENRLITGPAGEIPLRIYTPHGQAPFPVLVYFHGGGWVLGDLEIGDSCCRTFANQAGCVVVSVDYRLAPEYKFPAAPKDAYAATLWVANHAAEIGGDRNRIAIGGESAGGNLATVVAMMARERQEFSLVYQLLFYPVTQYGFNTDSYRMYDRDYLLTKDMMIWYWHHYLETPADGQNPFASPLLATQLSHLPPALIVTAEYDILRDEAEAYGDRLRHAGVPVKIIRYDGTIHGFISMGAAIDLALEAIANASTALRAAFQKK